MCPFFLVGMNEMKEKNERKDIIHLLVPFPFFCNVVFFVSVSC